jgi:hypothetical protein
MITLAEARTLILAQLGIVIKETSGVIVIPIAEVIVR